MHKFLERIVVVHEQHFEDPGNLLFVEDFLDVVEKTVEPEYVRGLFSGFELENLVAFLLEHVKKISEEF